MQVYAYIDGFNLYYGALKGSPYRWLDLQALAQLLMPRDHIARINYYTSRIRPREADPQQAQRQQAYLRALETIPNVRLQLGTFIGEAPREKGSDVNLATDLLIDAAKGNFEVALVLSNDSDLTPAIHAARTEFGARVGLVNPQLGSHISQDLLGASTFVKKLSKQKLADAQLPDEISDAAGTVKRPTGW